MACPTCDATMNQIFQGNGINTFWCPRCGSFIINPGSGEWVVYQPALIERIRGLKDEMAERVGFQEWDRQTWHRLGIFEAIYLPEERPAV